MRLCVFICESAPSNHSAIAVCLTEKESEGGEGRPALVQLSVPLAVYSLCVFSRGLFLRLRFCSTLLSFMFSPFFNMIMHSKGTRGTPLRAVQA